MAGRVGLRIEKLRDSWNNKDGARTLTHLERGSEVWLWCAPVVTRERVWPAQKLDGGVDLCDCRRQEVEGCRLARHELNIARLAAKQAIKGQARWHRHSPATVGAVLLILDVNVEGETYAVALITASIRSGGGLSRRAAVDGEGSPR